MGSGSKDEVPEIAPRVHRVAAQIETCSQEGRVMNAFGAMIRAVAVAVALGWAGPSAPALAQGTTADIVGIITDTSGGVLPGVAAIATNTSTGVVHTAVTDETGTFRLLLLPVGGYRIRIELQGFKTVTSDVTLAVGDRLRFDRRLEVGTLEETVNVRAESPVLQTQTSSMSTLTDARQMQDLPLNGRNFIRLAQVSPGSYEGPSNSLSSGNRPDDRRQSSSISINGGDPSYNNFLIDGIDNNERFIGTVIVRPTVDAIQEMKVDSNNFSADQGRSAGGVINILTKSGTNQMHGSSYLFYRNEALDSIDYFARGREKPAYDLKQFGGSLGGPIAANRTFFFGDYSGLRVDEGQTFTSTVPTASMRAGDFSGVANIYDPLTGLQFPGNVIPVNRIDPAAAAILRLIPLPQSNAAVNNYTYTPSKTQDDDSFDLKIDHRFSQKDSLFARYSFNNTTTIFPELFPSVNSVNAGGGPNFPGTADQRAQQVGVSWNRIWTPALLLEVKGGWSRYNADTVPTNYGLNVSQQVGIPGINVDADSSGLARLPIAGYFTLGDATFIPLLNENTVYQGLANVHYLKGAHTLKFGTDLKLRDFFAFQSNQARGQFSFNGNFTSNAGAAGTGNAIASFLLGYASATVRSKYLAEPTYAANEFSGYLQDDWRVRSRLTLNLGLRYDYYAPLTEAHNQIANVDLAAGVIKTAGQAGFPESAGVEPDRGNFSPRLGAAATLNDKTVLRGGYALSFSPPFVGTPLAFRNPPFVNLVNITPSTFVPINRLSEGLPPIAPTDPGNPSGNLAPVAFNLQIPYVHQFNATVQRELQGEVVVTGAFVGSYRRDEVATVAINNAPPGPGSVAARRPFRNVFPNVGGISLTMNAGTTDYRAMHLLVERRFTRGWGARAAYTLARSEGTQPDGQYPFSQIPTGTNPFPSLMDYLVFEQGPSPVASASGSSGQDIRHRVVVSFNYELPFAREARGATAAFGKGWQVNMIGVMQSGTPFTVTNSAARANTGGGDRPNQIGNPVLPERERTVTRWFNTAAFEAQPVNTLGNVTLNSLVGPGLSTVDLSVFKTLETGPARLQFRVETFNLFNRTNFDNPGSAFGSATFGVISGTRTRARNIQLGLKLLF
jgi:Carboxypeptidase regulatory-like domain/TonB dependent receptor